MSPSVSTPRAARRNGWVLVAVITGLLGFGGWLWASLRNGAVHAEESGSVRGSLHLETFVVNLADTDQRSYLRIGIDLGLAHELGKSENAPVAAVRDTILGVLAQCHASDLLSADGKIKLKQDLLHALQERLPALQVQDVYFNEFLIQR